MKGEGTMKDKKKMNETKRAFLLMTIPILLLFIGFNTIPLIRGFIYSFTNYKGYGSYDWVGLRNYIDLFRCPCREILSVYDQAGPGDNDCREYYQPGSGPWAEQQD